MWKVQLIRSNAENIWKHKKWGEIVFFRLLIGQIFSSECISILVCLLVMLILVIHDTYIKIYAFESFYDLPLNKYKYNINSHTHIHLQGVHYNSLLVTLRKGFIKKRTSIFL